MLLSWGLNLVGNGSEHTWCSVCMQCRKFLIVWVSKLRTLLRVSGRNVTRAPKGLGSEADIPKLVCPSRLLQAQARHYFRPCRVPWAWGRQLDPAWARSAAMMEFAGGKVPPPLPPPCRSIPAQVTPPLIPPSRGGGGGMSNQRTRYGLCINQELYLVVWAISSAVRADAEAWALVLDVSHLLSVTKLSGFCDPVPTPIPAHSW